MFEKMRGGVVDSFLNWFLGSKKYSDVVDWGAWLNYQIEDDETVEEKKKEFYLYLEGHVVKARFEVVVKERYAQLKVLILELDGQPISLCEQEEKAEEIRMYKITEEDQRRLLTKALAKFGVEEIKNMAMVSEDFARNYARLLRLQSGLYQRPSQEKRRA